MESYLDYNDDNHWKKVSEIVDNGGCMPKFPTMSFIVQTVEDLKIM